MVASFFCNSSRRAMFSDELTESLLHPINLGMLAAERVELVVQPGKRLLHGGGGGDGGVRWGVEFLRHWQRQLEYISNHRVAIVSS